MSLTVSTQAGFAALQQEAAQYLATKYPATAPAAQPAPPNPYGTLTQTYQSEAVSSCRGSATYTVNTVTASSVAYTSVGSGVLAVAQALKAATPVDTATGLDEISANAAASLSTALFNYFEPLLGLAPTNTTVTGGLSISGLNADIATAVQQFTSGASGGAFSLTLSTTKNSELDQSCTQSGSVNFRPAMDMQGVSVAQETDVISISITPDEQVSGSYVSNWLTFQQGTITVQGFAGADASLANDAGTWGGYSLDTTSLIPSGSSRSPLAARRRRPCRAPSRSRNRPSSSPRPPMGRRRTRS